MARTSVALGATNDSAHADVYTPKSSGRRRELHAPVLGVDIFAAEAKEEPQKARTRKS